MKTKLILSVGILCLTVSASAQNYSLNWFTTDGGGGTTTGGVFSLNGTIGQPDASAPMTGGAYSLVGGFWAFPVLIQTPATPALHLALIGNGLSTISWTPPT